MNSVELISMVKAKVKDESFSDAEILVLLNEALLKAAHDLCLPGLQKSDDITFTVGGDLFASLPDDYDHDLWHATNATEPWQDIKVYTSLHSLQRIHPREDITGYIRDVAADGNVLHVRPAPQIEQTVTFWYYRLPTLLVVPGEGDDPSIPEAIPAHLHGPVLAYYAISKLYDEIEDGVDGNKANTNNWETKWQRALLDLSTTKGVKRAARSTPVVKRHARYF